MGNSFRFCTLILAVSICGCAQKAGTPPPPPPQVTHDHPNPVTLQVQAGAPGYACTFTGGDDSKGNIEVKHSEGDVNIHVDLSADPNFAIVAPYFDNDPNEQLHSKPTDGGRKALIHDRNSGPLDAYYGLVVQDNSTSPATKFICDPRIVNN
jgi:hypothetical protein